MTLDDVFGSDLDRFPLEQEAADWNEGHVLVWDEIELQELAQYGMDRFALH